MAADVVIEIRNAIAMSMESFIIIDIEIEI
jgi:hypothetical protein